MFTGIIEGTGQVRAFTHTANAATLSIVGPQVCSDASVGDSIAVDGVCLTVTAHDTQSFTADVMAETLQRSSLGDLVPGGSVNLERALPSSGRFGGHIVQGHIDGTATVVKVRPAERWTVLRLNAPRALARYLAEKGSVALNGVSLTISALADDRDAKTGAGPQTWFEVSLIPTTLSETNLGAVRVGDRLNIEVDMIAKYLERLATVEVSR